MIAGFAPREAVTVAALVKFGLAGKELWERLYRLRAGPAIRYGLALVRPELIAGVKFGGAAARERSATACCSRFADPPRVPFTKAG